MQLKISATNQSSNEQLFESYTIEGHKTFDELIAVYHEFKRNNVGKSVILTLDDLGQAEYTSTHASMSHDLDQTEGYDLSGVDASAFENGEHIGYLSTPSEFFIRKANFKKKAINIDFSSACERGLAIDEKEILLLEKINQNPIGYLDKSIMVKIVPVDTSYEAVCGFPNGYFTCDLDPFENYAVAKHLNEKYGYELLGIGASLLGFIRSSHLATEQANQLVVDLMRLYNAQAGVFDKMSAIVQCNPYLFIKYTEHLA